METYETPTLEEIGSVAELTLASTDGSRLDQDYVAGSLVSDLTFS